MTARTIVEARTGLKLFSLRAVRRGLG